MHRKLPEKDHLMFAKCEVVILLLLCMSIHTNFRLSKNSVPDRNTFCLLYVICSIMVLEKHRLVSLRPANRLNILLFSSVSVADVGRGGFTGGVSKLVTFSIWAHD